MKRALLALIAALLAWAVTATLLDVGLRSLIPGYHAAEATFTFTTAMQLARLAIAAITSLVAGAVASRVAPLSPRVPWIAGALLLALFLPEHVRVWRSFPLWYHLLFLVTLVPLMVLGARIARGSAPAVAS